jgi:hypothetical protein
LKNPVSLCFFLLATFGFPIKRQLIHRKAFLYSSSSSASFVIRLNNLLWRLRLRSISNLTVFTYSSLVRSEYHSSGWWTKRQSVWQLLKAENKNQNYRWSIFQTKLIRSYIFGMFQQPRFSRCSICDGFLCCECLWSNNDSARFFPTESRLTKN